MYRKDSYNGADLPSKHLCLTYDDGPGTNTLDIAQFLADENIQATFFVVGKYAFHQRGTLEKISALGHLIGNHTFEHPDMPYYLSRNGDVQNQILRTDAVIREYINSQVVYFRSPYGKWSKEVADDLNSNPLTAINHIGPIHWDIGGVDCFYWKNGETVKTTVDKYLNDINEKQRGIVVMHDEIADMDYLKNSNQTLQLTRQLIPKLKEQGYKFVRLDQIASIKCEAFKLVKFTLSNSRSKFVSLSKNKIIIVDRSRDAISSELTLLELGDSKIALRASNNLFLSLNEEHACRIEATSQEALEKESFHLIPVSSNQIILRAYNGNYLTSERKSGDTLTASAPFMRGAEIFNFLPINEQPPHKSFGKMFRALKRQLLYLKSKIQERASS